MNVEQTPVELHPQETDEVVAIQGYVDYFARQIAVLNPQDEWYQPWSAYTLAVLLHADASGNRTTESLNRTYNNGLDTARAELGDAGGVQKQFTRKQWQLFRRIVFGGVVCDGATLNTATTPIELLEGIKTGIYGHRPLSELAHR